MYPYSKDPMIWTHIYPGFCLTGLNVCLLFCHINISDNPDKIIWTEFRIIVIVRIIEPQIYGFLFNKVFLSIIAMYSKDFTICVLFLVSKQRSDCILHTSLSPNLSQNPTVPILYSKP